MLLAEEYEYEGDAVEDPVVCISKEEVAEICQSSRRIWNPS